MAAGTYALLATSPSVLGFAGHATHFVVLAALGGILLLLSAVRSRSKWSLFWSGTILGLAFLMKQPGIFFVLFAGLYLLIVEWRGKNGWRDFTMRLAIFTFAAALPFCITCLWMWRAGVFRRFWFWTFTYVRLYGSMISIRQAPGVLWDNASYVIRPAVLIWIIAAMGLIIALWSRKTFDTLFFFGFLIFSFLAVCPGFYFREHYFIVILPAVSLLVGTAVTRASQKLRNRSSLKWLCFAPVLVFVVAAGYTIAQQWEFLFDMDPIAACRSMYGSNPFPEAIQIADHLKAHSSPSDTVAVIGSEPEIYFYSRRRSATAYIYTYSLMEEQPYAVTMQKEMISEIEDAKPKFLVFVATPLSWLRRPSSPTLIFEWVQKYAADSYQVDGLVDIMDQTQYRWGTDAVNYRPMSPYTVRIYKRTSS
jgi:hypothetical protein